MFKDLFGIYSLFTPLPPQYTTTYLLNSVYGDDFCWETKNDEEITPVK